MRNCGNCVYRDLLITEEPCFRCRYTEYWEFDDKEDENEDQDNI